MKIESTDGLKKELHILMGKDLAKNKRQSQNIGWLTI